MRITARQYAQAWYSALKAAPKSEWDAISRSVISTIHRQGKIKMFQEVVRGVQRLEDAETGTTSVTVRTAHAADEKTISELVATFLHTDKTRIHSVVDESLIGGAAIETENSRWDASVRGQLRSLEKTINA